MQSHKTSRPVALITGAARRIGAGIARRLHAAGYDLLLHYRNSDEAIQALCMELTAARENSVHAVAADLADAEAAKVLVDAALQRFGRLDALVNNASAFFASPLETTTAAQWDTLFAVNARAPFLLCQAAAPALRATHGAIVHLTDLHAARPRPDLLAYAASKAALEALTRGMAAALGPEVRVNAVAPGAILWPENEGDPAARQTMLANTPLARTGTVEDIAESVRWLLMDAGFVTGQILRVDGGRDAHWV
ncbi:pteridine reductase [Oleiagrimonas soli]|uniref:Pteridine reductase n=1 Tax=Oleiagrimonas soli TaxID=1543381 RepID=A0A099CYM2_9GAMM|nr:pteridine reductase [Oleiagrimonas soli]KGI78781.1 pteridine reductase [Oleiagrimonas soli]MBB6184452.1 pteridine reductase [Oleiagrimonas soli]